MKNKYLDKYLIGTGNGLINSTHSIRVSGYAIVEEKERIFVSKSSTSSDDISFDNSFYVQDK